MASFGIHASLLGGLAQSARVAGPVAQPHAGERRAAVAVATQQAPETVEIEVALLAEAESRTWVPEQPDPVVDAPEGERDRDRAVSVAPARADGVERRAPAPDEGDEGGRRPGLAWRHDRSSLQSRLTDGADRSQPSRLRTASHARSPQSIRREPVTGRGDSIRTRAAADRPAPSDGGPGLPPERAEAQAALLPTGPGGTVAAPRAEVPRVGAAVSLQQGEGPLDAEAGERSFDNELGRRASDTISMRAASSERHPGITDLSRAGVVSPHPGLHGQGPSQTPGAVSRPSRGTAPAEYGSRRAEQLGDQVAERSRDRTYDRYFQDIQRRVNGAREFPKTLALRLEQGETIVRFVLEPSGRIRDGIAVSKSSGFSEFDSAAVRAVQRAGPFPPMPDPGSARPISVNVRISFDNPVIR